MNIALFTDTYLPEINGVATSVATLYKALKKQGHNVYVVTTKAGITKKTFENNILRLPGLELKALYGYKMTSFIHLSTLNNEIKNMNLDIIHSHTEFGIGIFARICSRALSIPLVSTYHTTYEDYTHYVNKLQLGLVDDLAKNAVGKLSKLYVDSGMCVIAPSEKTKEMLERYKIKSKIFVIPTGLDLDRFDSKNTNDSVISQIKQECQITKQKMLLFLGRIAKEKSVDVLIKTMSLVKAANLPVKLVIVGDGPAVGELKQMVIDEEVENFVFFAGKKDGSLVPSYYHACDMFVSASVTETQGLTYIEALASKTVVFASDPEVVSGLVIPNKTGYLFTDSDDLFVKIQTYLNKSATEQLDMQTMAAEVVKKYDANLFAQKVLEVYDVAINDYSGLLVIDKIKLKNDYVQLFLKNDLLETKILVSTENYYNLGLRKDNPITKTEYKYLVQEEKLVLAYEAALKKISFRDYSIKEIRDFFLNKQKLNEKEAQIVITKLEDKGFLDDRKYVETQKDLLLIKLYSRNNIISHLKKKGISQDIIDEYFLAEDESDLEQEYENAFKIAERYQLSLTKYAVKMQKDKIKQKLYRNGFTIDCINRVMDNLDFAYEELNENQKLKEQYIKAKKRYSKKYSGYELRNHLYKYLLSQGFEIDSIYLILSEGEWNND